MRTPIAAVVAALAFAVGIGSPAAARIADSYTSTTLTADTAPAPVTWNGYEEHYLSTRDDFVKSFGVQQAGRDIVRTGILRHGEVVKPAPRNLVEDSIARMDAALHPPEPAAAPAPDTTTTPPPPTYSSGGCPSYMAAEATSPDAVNPTSGAAGCYQVLPSTAAAMGSACDDVNAPSCVAAICASQGNGAWASSGATPC